MTDRLKMVEIGKPVQDKVLNELANAVLDTDENNRYVFRINVKFEP